VEGQLASLGTYLAATIGDKPHKLENGERRSGAREGTHLSYFLRTLEHLLSCCCATLDDSSQVPRRYIHASRRRCPIASSPDLAAAARNAENWFIRMGRRSCRLTALAKPTKELSDLQSALPVATLYWSTLPRLGLGHLMLHPPWFKWQARGQPPVFVSGR
jgi:hypothetical protein